MPTIDTSREAVEALMEGVTEGPWEASRCPSNEREIVEHPDLGRIANLSYPDAGDDEANARFIAASRQLVPALLDRAEKAEARAQKAEAELYAFKLAFAGGEDAPGAAARVTVQDVERWMAEAARESSDLATLKAEREGLRRMLHSLHAIIDAEMPETLDDDRGGNGALGAEVQAALGDA